MEALNLIEINTTVRPHTVMRTGGGHRLSVLNSQQPQVLSFSCCYFSSVSEKLKEHLVRQDSNPVTKKYSQLSKGIA